VVAENGADRAFGADGAFSATVVSIIKYKESEKFRTAYNLDV
jgi:hypothetical protein